MKPHPFDSLDYQIIQQFDGNIRADAAKIARSLGANERTIRKRINRMFTLEAVAFAALLNPVAFRYVTTVQFVLEIDPAHEADAIAWFLGMPEIAYVAYGQGEREVCLQAHFKDNGEMHEFIRGTLPHLAGVTVRSTTIVPRVLRSRETWQPRAEDFGPETPEPLPAAPNGPPSEEPTS